MIATAPLIQPRRQCGMALLLVLWIVAIASLLLGHLAVRTQIHSHQALWMRQHTQALFTAEAGLNLAVVKLLHRDISQRSGADMNRTHISWRADGQLHRLSFAGNQLSIQIMSERGKLDLNAAGQSDLRAVWSACDAGKAARETALSALMTRRARQPLRMPDELRALPGVDDRLYRCLLPAITVWSGNARPDATLVSPWLARALDMNRMPGVASDPGQIVNVVSVATLTDGFQTRLDVTLALAASTTGKPYQVLRWQP